MRRILDSAPLVALVMTLALAGWALAADPPAVPVQVTNFGGKPPVTFDHARHVDSACTACHHLADEGQFKCGDCHAGEAQTDVPKIKDAMHKKDSGKCYGCHFGTEATAKQLKCAECHVKQ